MPRERIGYGEEGYGYSWRLNAVYKEDGKFYLVEDAGCSCNGPESSYGLDSAVLKANSIGDLIDQYVIAGRCACGDEAMVEALKHELGVK